MNKQLSILELIEQGEKLRDEGITLAVDHADSPPPYDWSDKAYQFLVSWLGTIPQGYCFMVEDCRMRAERLKVISLPPSKRAWGAIVLKAKKNGLIKSNGFDLSKNPNCHRTPASVWIKI